MKKLTRDHTIYKLSKDIPPVLEASPGEILVLETLDAASGRIRVASDIFSYEKTRSADKANPATGPIFVKGAQPGDTLVVDVLDIKVDAQGYRVLLKGSGNIIEDMKTPQGMIVSVKNNLIIYDDNIKLPLRPMIGVIGVAPTGEGVRTFNPGPHGGNMDNNLIAIGTRVYLPVFVLGALLAIGDLHASMGDGELTGGGIDINGEVIIRLDLIKQKSWPRPWLETRDSWATCSNAPTLEDAIAIATRDMVNLLVEKVGVNKECAFMMIGSHGDIKIGQAAKIKDLDTTVCLTFPKIVT